MIKQKFSDLITLMNRNDRMCQGASQQMTNGFYRIFEALKEIVAELDENEIKKTTVANLSNLLDRNDRMCQGAPQQCANGSYRIAEILEVLIDLLDADNKYSSEVKAILNTMNRNNNFCQGAPQQTANGVYRIVELLEILVKLIAPSKSTSVASYISVMNRNNNLCQGAPQQSANGTDAAFLIVQDIVKALDTKNKYGSNLSLLVTLKNRNNSLCQGADQQSGNNLYRTMETIQVLGNIIHDKNQERIELYWKEHADRYNELMAEKKENQDKIKEIKKEADAINEDSKLSKLYEQIAALKDKKDAVGAEELASFSVAVKRLEEERAQIGLFKFALRKEATAKITEAQAAYANKIVEVEGIKNGIQLEIDALENEVSALKAEVDRKKAAVLKRCDAHNTWIKKIDYELTKKR